MFCDDVVYLIFVIGGYDNDVFYGGFVCDGCDIFKVVFDWDIICFEINDDNNNLFNGFYEKMYMSMYIWIFIRR